MAQVFQNQSGKRKTKGNSFFFRTIKLAPLHTQINSSSTMHFFPANFTKAGYLGKMADNKVERMLLHVRGSNPVSRLKDLVNLVEMQYQCFVTSPELISFKASVPADILSTSFYFYRQKRHSA